MISHHRVRWDVLDFGTYPPVSSLTSIWEGPGHLVTPPEGFRYRISMTSIAALGDGSTHYLMR
jgi:hypothetical protein